jgi:hypothetical protein
LVVVSYKKQPELRYKLMGGINTKVSQYLNSPMEFLDLKNLDFQTPGSLTERWGSTQLYNGASYFTGQVYGLFNYNKINGDSSMIVAGSTGAWYSGAFSGLTALLGAVSHGSMIYFSEYVNFATFGVTTSPATSAFQGNASYDFQVFNNELYACNGRDFWRWNGSSFYFFGLPLIGAGNLAGVGITANTWNVVAGSSGVATGATGECWFALAYANEKGVIGNATVAGFGNQGFQRLQGATSVTISLTEQLVRTMNPGFGLSQILAYMTPPQTSSLNFLNGGAPLYYVGSFGLSAASGNGLTLVISSTQIASLGPTTAITQTIPYGRWYYSDAFGLITSGQSYQVVNGFTWPINSTISLYANSYLANTAFGNMVPSMMENIDGTMFYAGCSFLLSSVLWADFGVPERISANSNVEVRTNDGEIVTAIKSYNGNLIVCKQSTFHVLNVAADDPANWQLSQISSEYGCLGRFAITEYANYLVFLDRKGIIRYTGANIEILSTKVDPIFARMNIPACKDNAKVNYDKQRNQILCDIPVDGSTMANLTAVYDIVSQAWTTYEGYKPAATVRSQIPTKDAIVYGGYSGLVSYFGPSFLTDNGTGFTMLAKSGFLTDMGESVTKVFRRLFLDTSPVGSSSFIDINLYQDFGSSKVVSATMMLNMFQSRIDFGVSGKSLSAEFVCGSTIGLALHGFAIQYRFQRNV